MIVLLCEAVRKFFMMIQMFRKKSFEQISIHAKEKNQKFLSENPLFALLGEKYFSVPLFVAKKLCVPPPPPPPPQFQEPLVVINDTSLTHIVYNGTKYMTYSEITKRCRDNYQTRKYFLYLHDISVMASLL